MSLKCEKRVKILQTLGDVNKLLVFSDNHFETQRYSVQYHNQHHTGSA